MQLNSLVAGYPAGLSVIGFLDAIGGPQALGHYVAILTILVLVVIVIWQTISLEQEKKRIVHHNDDLLNRLMARDFTEYATGSRALPVNYKHISEYIARGQEKQAEGEEQPADDGLGIPVA